jgi:CHASE2 domain-containing sensor protein
MLAWAATSHTHYFLLLGIFVALVATATILTGHWKTFEHKTFDLFMQKRFHAPTPNPDIVLADIDEHSLAAMSADYGRWPWPRRVLGEFIENIEAQHPRAIILDVLIADPDLQNPDSETAFDSAVKNSPHVFYTSIRLPAKFDDKSALTVDQVPGVIPPNASAPPHPRVAILLPYLGSILESKRIGTTNLLSDTDGVARAAYLYHDFAGWHIPSLPAVVATKLGYPLPPGDRVPLNWRGPPGAYPHISFSDIYLDTLRQKPGRPKNEFKDKIVFIGSSAVGLFDLRPTPVSTVHPGTEVLATALDNIMQGDYIRLSPLWLSALLTAGFVMALAWMFAFQYNNRIADGAFFTLQILFGIFAFALIHFAPIYIDASAPITFGTAYFGLARLSLVSRERAQTELLREKLASSPLSVHIFWVRTESFSAKRLAYVQRLVTRSAKRSRLKVASLSPPTDSLGILKRAFDGELGLVWFAAGSGEEDEQVNNEISQLASQLDAWAKARTLSLQHRVYSAIIPSALEAEHSFRLKQVLENVFATSALLSQEISHEKQNNS